MSAEDCVGCKHINNCLGDCVGYEEVKPQKQTNEEWLCSLPTEEKAKVIMNIKNLACYQEQIVVWLKEKHK